VVIPTRNEEIEEVKSLVRSLRRVIKEPYIFFIDDSNPIYHEKMRDLVSKMKNVYLLWHEDILGYGKALKYGLAHAVFTFDCDYVLEMDVDHPVEPIPLFFTKLLKDKCDFVVGYEETNIHRRVTRFLFRLLRLGFKLKHPTCGFVLWRGEVLRYIPWERVKSKRDAVHIELLYWAWKRGFRRVGEVHFTGHKGERRYSFRRCLSWLISWFRVFRLRYFWNWREF